MKPDEGPRTASLPRVMPPTAAGPSSKGRLPKFHDPVHGSSTELFSELGTLIVEGRQPRASGPRGYGEGPHCRGVEHRCDQSLIQCQLFQQRQEHIFLLWRNSIPMCIEVLLYPECCSAEVSGEGVTAPLSPDMSYCLLEQWTLHLTTTRIVPAGTAGPQQLVQAVRSYLHFSQMSAWLSTSQGKAPHNIHYRMCVPGEAFSCKFSENPEIHTFPVSCVGRYSLLKVQLKSRPRSERLPSLHCRKHCLAHRPCRPPVVERFLKKPLGPPPNEIQQVQQEPRQPPPAKAPPPPADPPPAEEDIGGARTKTWTYIQHRRLLLKQAAAAAAAPKGVLTIPSAESKAQFRRSLDSATYMVFHQNNGLPLTSSPAPIRKSGTCFDFDSSLTSVSAIKRALFEEEEEEEGEGARCHPGASSPATTSALLGNFEESVLNGRLEPASTVEGFMAEIGASGSFVPRHLRRLVTVFFYNLHSSDKVTAPYLGHINLGKKGYQVPKAGTIQVTLFNPHGTVVKMFVVRYDVSDMPPSCQTFLRQRTLYMPTNATEDDPESRKWLRYLIHLRFLSTRSGRVYLHTDIRVIIFNKSDLDAAAIHGDTPYELRSFTQYPLNPKFSPHK